MDMVIITSYFKKRYFISFGNFQTNVFQILIYIFVKDHLSIFGGTNQVID